MTTEVQELTEAVEDLTKELTDQRERLRWQGKFLVALAVCVALIVGLIIALVVVGTRQQEDRDAQRVTRVEALCPLYYVFLDSYNQQQRDAMPPAQQSKYDNAFTTIRHGSEVLGCKR